MPFRGWFRPSSLTCRLSPPSRLRGAVFFGRRHLYETPLPILYQYSTRAPKKQHFPTRVMRLFSFSGKQKERLSVRVSMNLVPSRAAGAHHLLFATQKAASYSEGIHHFSFFLAKKKNITFPFCKSKKEKYPAGPCKPQKETRIFSRLVPSPTVCAPNVLPSRDESRGREGGLHPVPEARVPFFSCRFIEQPITNQAGIFYFAV